MKKHPNEALALFSLIFLAPILLTLLMAIGFALLILCFGGVDDLLKVAHNFSWNPEYEKYTTFKILVGVVIVSSAALTLYIWRKIFYQ